MRIAACIIVKNCARSIENAISSVKSHVDDIIVVDTGSTDNSIEIACEHGAQVYSHLWNDNFAEARNTSLAYANSADWVLVIDADEEFIWQGDVSLREWISLNLIEDTSIVFESHHIEQSNLELMAITHVERLFSPKKYRFTGSIHEKLEHKYQKKNKPIYCTVALFRHYGYSAVYYKKKSRRNIKLLYKELELDRYNGMAHRYLSTEHYNAEDYLKSIHHVTLALKYLEKKETYSRGQAHYYHIMSWIKLNRIQEAEQAIRACVIELPYYADPYGIAAELYYSHNRWKEAFDSYLKWESAMDSHGIMMPNHCISLKNIFIQHKWISLSKTNKTKDLLRREDKTMKIALVIPHPHLEMDLEDLFHHISNHLIHIEYEIGLWTNLTNKNKFNTLIRKNKKIRWLNGSTVSEVSQRFAKETKADIIWTWYPNERSTLLINEELIMHTLMHNGQVHIQQYSERLGSSWSERRLQLTSEAGQEWGESLQHIAASLEHEDEQTSGAKINALSHLTVIKPFIVPLELQDSFLEATKATEPQQQLLTAFACQRYEDVLDMHEAETSPYWTTYQFYHILSAINLNRLEEASEKIYYALDSHINEQEMLDFMYLYGKLAVNTNIEQMKEEAIELLHDTIRTQLIMETKHVLTTESDWLMIIAELEWQLGRKKQALITWSHSLESSAYKNERAAYRLAEAIYEEYSPEGLEKISRKIIEVFNIDSYHAKALLSPIFSYLNMKEWAAIFSLSSKQPQNARNEMPLVSIVLPVYNDTSYFFESIRTILSQTYVNLELIIVDDGSTPGVGKIAERFKYDNRVQYHRLETNKGLPYALNFGFSKAKGELRGWTSSDNYVHPRWLERMVETISSNEAASAVYSDYYHIDEHGIVIETKYMPNYILNGLQNGGPSLIWKTSIQSKVGQFDELLFGIEDRDFTIRLAFVGPLLHLHEPLYYYRVHNESLSSKIENGTLGGWSALHEKIKRKWVCLSFV